MKRWFYLPITPAIMINLAIFECNIVTLEEKPKLKRVWLQRTSLLIVTAMGGFGTPPFPSKPFCLLFAPILSETLPFSQFYHQKFEFSTLEGHKKNALCRYLFFFTAIFYLPVIRYLLFLQTFPLLYSRWRCSIKA